MSRVPPPADGTRFRVAFCCLGNICRSPMAEVVLRSQADRAGLADRLSVSSCGTGPWHRGDPMNPAAAAVLTAAGYDPTGHRGSQFDMSWLDNDLLLAMDADNLATVRRLAAEAGVRIDDERVRMFREFDPVASADGVPDLPDPYGGSPVDFEDTLEIVERTCAGLLAELADVV